MPDILRGFSNTNLAELTAPSLGGRLSVVEDTIGLWRNSPTQQILERIQRDERQWNMISSLSWRDDYLAHLGGYAAEALASRYVNPIDSAVWQNACGAAQLAQSCALPEVLEHFRTRAELLTWKLSTLPSLDWMQSPSHLSVFNEVSAFSDLVAQSVRVDSTLRSAMTLFSGTLIPDFGGLAGYRQFLDAAGFTLSRWPRVRLLTAAEKRRRFKLTLQQKAETPHLKRAKSIVHRYELILREIIDSAMAETYGEDWAMSRLTVCGCRDLLGKWQNRGGEILDHADYAHYERIMSHPEHFSAVFEAAFDDRDALAELIRRAGQLRARSHHPGHPFTMEDLRDLRLTWRSIETGLLALTPDFDIDI
ncbi:hypothetical protein [Rhodopseudomonas telluris]|uniref:HEPN AbiU2-like domain-containing protein n=1 Tax=Rhodopseudomonas telluris TaxID=644215 RepID=A0ABV6ELA3_9BRAD